jgi:hypothetical protein
LRNKLPLEPNTKCGNFHNGRASVVRCEDNFYLKPRCVLWEFLLLSKASPLLSFLLSEANFASAALQLLQCTTVKKINSLSPLGAGKVLALLEPSQLERPLTNDEASLLGSLIGLVSWLGLTDLHSENVIVGIKPDGFLTCTPIDIESAFNDLLLPSQTGLLPSKDIPHNRCGLSSVIEQVKACAGIRQAFLVGIAYFQTIEELFKLEKKLEQVHLGFEENFPSRVFFSPTTQYVNFLKTGVFQPKLGNRNLLPEEIIQLNRGDIPYFYRYLFSTSKNGIYFLNSAQEELILKSKLPVNLTVPLSFGSMGKGLMRSNGQMLAKGGVCQILRILLQNTQCGRLSISDNDIEVNSNSIRIRLGATNLECLR